MRLLTVFAPVLLALTLLAAATAPVAAQDDPAPSELDIEDIAGLEKMYGRSFAADMMAMIGLASPEAVPTGWFVLTTLVLEFDSEHNARGGYEQMNQETASGASGRDVDMERLVLDLDMTHTAQQMVAEAEGMTTSMVLVTAQDGAYVYAVSAVAFGDDPTAVVEAIAREMQEADTTADEEVFREDGTSVGGLWAKLPSVERVRQQVPALTLVNDVVYVSMTVPSATPMLRASSSQR